MRGLALTCLIILNLYLKHNNVRHASKTNARVY